MKPKQSATINAYPTPAEKAFIEEAAAADRRSASSFVVAAAMAAAEAKLGRRFSAPDPGVKQ